MTITEILNDKEIKPKEKTSMLSKLLLSKKLNVDAVINFAATAKDPVKATCIEAIEQATKEQPALCTLQAFQFVTNSLTEKAPRIKWESARVIGNTAHLFTNKLGDAIKHLLVNTEHEGTVVRWSAAYALAEILKLGTKHNKELLPAVQAITGREEKDSIKKIYAAALKRVL